MEKKTHRICEILDKLTLDALHLIEEEVQLKLNLENAMIGGESHLAKSRYIMGQNNVSALQLPTEDGKEFSASIKVAEHDSETLLDNPELQLKTVKKSEDESVQEPLRWFGVLVPQNLSHSQNMFRQALQWAVQAVNVQIRLKETINKIGVLKEAKQMAKLEE
ncbi:unnamed protein product [Acanthoscelides obtectus]|uniref:Vacuolar ATPase assembly protein VMA22 n=1 Tax=Acanthoscelides obtectus TaxID=200917 RepID=A0A9P0NWH7_ACAOB|nr:unnamed protein product [Acanthoscelides obtectus]CAK1663781.1 Coiled-coil domain-containing protein 115 [Acanthoscelides obtectus]